MRPVEALVNVPDPAWPALHDELAAAPVGIQMLPIDDAAGRRCLYQIQVTTRSRLGALAMHTAGLLVDGGWLRVLGGGDQERGLPSLAQANGLDDGPRLSPAFVVGYDILGGQFEINGADPAGIGRPGEPGQVCYFGPDTLRWHCLGFGHGAWLSWIATGNTTVFYASMRWPGWREETEALDLTQGITMYPFVWSKQAQADLGGTSRRPVPIAEIFGIQEEFVRRLGSSPVSLAEQ